MEDVVFKEWIAVTRDEEQRRESLLTDASPESYWEWKCNHESLINGLCLTILVALRHQVERELVYLAARAANEGDEICGEQFSKNVEGLQRMKTKKRCKEIKGRLSLEGCEEYRSMEALRLLINSYKHDPFEEPDKGLLEWLGLESNVSYARLAESDKVREGVAAFIGLQEDASYCDIAERFVVIASNFLENVGSRTKLSTVKLSPGLIDDFAR